MSDMVITPEQLTTLAEKLDGLGSTLTDEEHQLLHAIFAVALTTVTQGHSEQGTTPPEATSSDASSAPDATTPDASAATDQPAPDATAPEQAATDASAVTAPAETSPAVTSPAETSPAAASGNQGGDGRKPLVGLVSTLLPRKPPAQGAGGAAHLVPRHGQGTPAAPAGFRLVPRHPAPGSSGQGGPH